MYSTRRVGRFSTTSRRSVRGRLSVLVGVSAVLVLTACSQDTAAPVPPASGTEAVVPGTGSLPTGTGSATPPATVESLGSVSGIASAGTSAELSPTTSAFVSPLEEYVGVRSAGGDPEAGTVGDDQKVQNLLATCMAEAGFEFVPVDYSSMYAPPEDDPYKYYGTREWAAKFGYGVTTAAELYPTEPVVEEEVDPNQALLEAMTEDEQNAYYDALYGSMIAPEPEPELPPAEEVEPTEDGEHADEGDDGHVHGSSAPVPAGSGGCQEEASREVYGDDAYDRTDGPYAQYEDMFAELDRMYEEQAADPALVTAVQTWSECMSEAGYPGYTNIYDPQSEINEAYVALVDAEVGVQDPDPEAVEVTDEIVPVESPAVAELRDRELAVAVADFDCQIPYKATADASRIAAEESFIAEHRAELDAYRDQVESGGN